MNKRKGTTEMKTLKEMGISPAPWTATVDANGEIMVNDENRYGIAAFGFVAEGDVNYANARLTAAAPELYEALREAMEERCRWCGYDEQGIPETCVWQRSCPVQRWRKVIEKAGGAK